MKRAIVIANERAEHQQSFGGAFAKGLQRHGWNVSVRTEAEKCDLLVIWGARRSDRIRHQLGVGGEICVLERGYVGDRFIWTSVSFGGGLNGRGVFRGALTDPSRWERHFAHLMQPWRTPSDGYALIMEQVPGDTAVMRVDLPRFYGEARAAFEPKMPVRLRPHPNVHPTHGARAIGAARASLAQDLAGARVAITWNSNSAVDAVLAGVPTIAMDRGSMAWGVTGHALAMPPMPDRSAWAHALAWKQWTRDELESGACWEHVGASEACDAG
jgi:hypothetical protein